MTTVFLPLRDTPEGDDAPIDAAALRRAREARGLSVSEAARQLTLSRAQVEQIEEGGVSAFYSPAHKALAVRKYAAGFGVEIERVMGSAAAVAEPDSVPEASAGQAPPQPPESREPLARVDVRASVSSLVLGCLLLGAAAITFAVARGWVDRFASPPPSMTATPAERPLAPAAQAAKAPDLAVADPLPSRSAIEPCAVPAATDPIPQWTPPYVRKASTRLHISGPAGSEVCVSDSAGKVTRFVLTGGAMQAVDGRPPYLVQSASLAALQMFLQGLKVTIPAQSAAMRLLPGRGPAADAQAAESPPAS